MGEEKQQGERRTGNGSAQGRRPVSGRSSIYGSKESQQMMKRSAQHSAQARRVQTGEEKRAVSGYEKRTKKEGMQSENAKAGVEKRRSGQTASGVPAERNIKKTVTRRTSLAESEGVGVRPERKKVSGSLSASENGSAPKKSRKYASEVQKAGSSKKTESEEKPQNQRRKKLTEGESATKRDGQNMHAEKVMLPKNQLQNSDKAKYPHRARISAATNSLPAVSGDLAVSCLSCILQ